jgi:hypothetical protein
MDFELNEEQQMIIDMAGKIAKVFGLEYWLEKETEGYLLNLFPQWIFHLNGVYLSSI